MAVVDRHELAIEITRLAERVEDLRLVDDITRLGCRVHVAAAEDTTDDLVLAEEEAAAFLRRGRAGMGDDLIAQLACDDETGAVDQRPPAIAGITMTSLPSGTAAPLPPRARASSSPM